MGGTAARVEVMALLGRDGGWIEEIFLGAISVGVKRVRRRERRLRPLPQLQELNRGDREKDREGMTATSDIMALAPAPPGLW